MTDKEFFNGLAKSKSDVVQKLLDLIDENKILYCVIGGLAVNAYVEPVVSLDLDMVILKKDLKKFKHVITGHFEIKEFAHSLNLYSSDSDFRIQIQTDTIYQSFVSKAAVKEILGYKMKVASLEDILQGKIWAYSDEERRKSKRQKDLADIFRIVEVYPDLVEKLPEKIRTML